MNSHHVRGTGHELRGLVPPLVTPFTDDDRIDLESLQRQASWLMDAGAQGLWLNGTTGEFFALNEAERTAAIASVRAVVPPDKGFIVGQIGAPSTREALRLAGLAADAGADFLAAVTPYYVEFDDRELTEYYREIRASVDLPLLVYQVPMMAKTRLQIPTVLRLVEEEIVIGIKDSSNDIGWLKGLLAAARRAGLDLRAFVGGGRLVDASILAGASGAMCAIANLVPTHCANLVHAALTDDWSTARELQAELLDLTEAMELPDRNGWGQTLATYKFLLAESDAITADICRAPLRALNRQERDHLHTHALPIMRRLESNARTTVDAGLGMA